MTNSTSLKLVVTIALLLGAGLLAIMAVTNINTATSVKNDYDKASDASRTVNYGVDICDTNIANHCFIWQSAETSIKSNTLSVGEQSIGLKKSGDKLYTDKNILLATPNYSLDLVKTSEGTESVCLKLDYLQNLIGYNNVAADLSLTGKDAKQLIVANFCNNSDTGSFLDSFLFQ